VSRAAGDPTLRANLRRYRMLQSLYVYQHHSFGSVTDAELDELRARLTRREQLAYGTTFTVASAGSHLLPARARRIAGVAFALAQRQAPYWRPGRIPGRFRDVRDVLDLVDRDPSSAEAPV
jgi:hypothetical protein